MSDVRIVTDNTDEVIDAVNEALDRALEIIGIKAERYAKALCPVGTPESTGKKGYIGGTLRNSISHEVDDKTLSVGTNVEYAPFVELGTGPYFEPPPEWEQFTSERGSGVGHGYVHPRPFLRPAIVDHVDEYKSVVKGELER